MRKFNYKNSHSEVFAKKVHHPPSGKVLVNVKTPMQPLSEVSVE